MKFLLYFKVISEDDFEIKWKYHSFNNSFRSVTLYFSRLSHSFMIFKLLLRNLDFSLFLASVFCVSLDPWSYTYGVSGGEDDKAFVWKISDGKVKFPCEGWYQVGDFHVPLQRQWLYLMVIILIILHSSQICLTNSRSTFDSGQMGCIRNTMQCSATLKGEKKKTTHSFKLTSWILYQLSCTG